LTRVDRLDVITVRVEAQREASGRAADRQHAGSQLEAAIKGRIGITATVVVSDPGTVERSSGKAKRVVDRR
jgi:phenylacetate-CoA ligase